MLGKIKNRMPWKIRLRLHLFLAKHPQFYIKAIRQNDTDFESVWNIFAKHLDYLGAPNLEGKTLCEIGPGQSVNHAVQAYMAGAGKTWFLDIEELAERETIVDLSQFRNKPSKKELPIPEVGETWKLYLEKLDATYLTAGLDSYREVPDGSIDYLFSNAVLEHVRRDIFEETIRQMYRMCRKGALCSHVIDYRDHLGGGINQYRFSEEEWESAIYKAMPNYVNRITYYEMVDIFKRVGFQVVEAETKKWDRIPLEQKEMAEQFLQFDYECFRVKTGRLLVCK